METSNFQNLKAAWLTFWKIGVVKIFFFCLFLNCASQMIQAENFHLAHFNK